MAAASRHHLHPCLSFPFCSFDGQSDARIGRHDLIIMMIVLRLDLRECIPGSLIVLESRSVMIELPVPGLHLLLRSDARIWKIRRSTREGDSSESDTNKSDPDLEVQPFLHAVNYCLIPAILPELLFDVPLTSCCCSRCCRRSARGSRDDTHSHSRKRTGAKGSSHPVVVPVCAHVDDDVLLMT